MPLKKSKAAVVESPMAEKSLQQIAHCLGYLILQTDKLKNKTNNDLIPIMSSLGFDRGAIATMLQTTPETVSVRLSQLKAKSERKRSSKKEAKSQIDNE